MIFALPWLTPVTVPNISTEAIPELEEDHVPPVVVLANGVVRFLQTEPAPVRAAGRPLTVAVTVRAHPVDNVYEMVVLPWAAPKSMPVAGSMLAMKGAVLVHVPPAVKSERGADASSHTTGLPLITAGLGFTSIDIERLQPVDKV